VSNLHAYDDNGLSAKEFLYAVMRDPLADLGHRMDAACKLMELEANEPNYYGKYPISRAVEVTIRIAPINGHVQTEHHPANDEVGFGPREDEQVGAQP
jgi:hypothetical protein